MARRGPAGALSGPASARRNPERASAPLPRELFVLYAIAPLLYAPVLQRRIFELPAATVLMAIGGNYVPFLAIPAVLHPFYRVVMPRLAGRVRSVGGRLVVHAACCAAVAAAVALLVYPVFALFCVGGPRPGGFAAACVVMTWTLALPALLVQELRDRNEAIARRLAAERQAALRAEIEALQSRTNPHFLFNALNTVAGLIHDQPDLAERTVERLADILRYTLQHASAPLVTLEREVAIVRDYLEIQRARFGERLGYTIDVEGGLEGLALPPLVLQPLVENAVLHGVAPLERGGSVRVQARRRGAAVVLSVQDDGAGQSGRRGSGTSLRDLERRLALLYGAACEVAIGPSGQGGLSVTITVPWRRLG